MQTVYPENNVLQALLNNDRQGFIEFEKQSRRLLHYPPFGKLAALIVSGTNAGLVEKTAVSLGRTAPHTEQIEVLGPAPAPLYLLKDKYRFRLLIKTDRRINLQNVLKEWLAMNKIPNNVRVEVDIDPYSFM